MLEANDSLSEAQKDIRARNTFLLALDGDVDFQPDAIVKLVKELIKLVKILLSIVKIKLHKKNYFGLGMWVMVVYQSQRQTFEVFFFKFEVIYGMNLVPLTRLFNKQCLNYFRST
jgi:hypothetical protein